MASMKSLNSQTSLYSFTSQASLACIALNVIFQTPTEQSTELWALNDFPTPKFQSSSIIFPQNNMVSVSQ